MVVLLPEVEKASSVPDMANGQGLLNTKMELSIR